MEHWIKKMKNEISKNKSGDDNNVIGRGLKGIYSIILYGIVIVTGAATGLVILRVVILLFRWAIS